MARAPRGEAVEDLLDLLVMMCGALWACTKTSAAAELVALFFTRPDTVNPTTRREVATMALVTPDEGMRLESPGKALVRWSSRASSFERERRMSLPPEWCEMGELTGPLAEHCRNCAWGSVSPCFISSGSETLSPYEFEGTPSDHR
jgi:hypothetical protein